MPSKTNTDKIDDLNVTCATLSARLDALLTEVRATTSNQGATAIVLTAMKTQLAVVEVHVSGIAQLKVALEAVTVLEKELALLKKDLEGFSKWKDDLKKEMEEHARRWWSFWPAITAANISGTITLIGIGINYWLN